VSGQAGSAAAGGDASLAASSWVPALWPFAHADGSRDTESIGPGEGPSR
jgi:hypothetical protein